MRWNEIEEDEARYLASPLQLIEELDLIESGINLQGAKALSTAIKRMKFPVCGVFWGI